MDTNKRTRYTHLPLGEALIQLLFAHQANPWRTSLMGFAAEIGVNYATLRSAVMGRTVPKPALIETIAKTLGLEPSYFREYRIHKINEATTRIMESRPEQAGRFYELIMAEAAALDELQEGTVSAASPAAKTPDNRTPSGRSKLRPAKG
jgi:hypothetical protein